MSYERYTYNPNNIEFCNPCYLCNHPDERPKRNKQKCSSAECDYLKCYEKLARLEDMIEDADKVIIYAKPPYETRYAVVEYYARKGKPLAVAQYHISGRDLKSGEELICWQWLPSTNFTVVEKSFKTEEEALVRLKELKSLVTNEGGSYDF